MGASFFSAIVCEVSSSNEKKITWVEVISGTGRLGEWLPPVADPFEKANSVRVETRWNKGVGKGESSARWLRKQTRSFSNNEIVFEKGRKERTREKILKRSMEKITVWD